MITNESCSPLIRFSKLKPALTVPLGAAGSSGTLSDQEIEDKCSYT